MFKSFSLKEKERSNVSRFHSTASTARSPGQLPTSTGFSGRSTFSCTVQPQASKDKYTHLLAGDRGTQWLCLACHSDPLPPLTVEPAMSGFPRPGNPCSPRPLQGPRARGRGAHRRWTRVPPSAGGVSLPSPLLPSKTRAPRGPASPCASARNSPARPFSHLSTRSGVGCFRAPTLRVHTLPPTDAENGF